MVEIRYAGVTVARSSAVRELDTKGLFLGLTEPLPTGTDVLLKVGEQEVPCRVATVFESADISKAGMRVLFRVAGQASLFGEPANVGAPEPLPAREPSRSVSAPTPVPAPTPAPAPTPTPTPAAPAAAVKAAGSGPAAASSGPVASAREAGAPEASLSGASSGRRIVIDASAEKPVPDRLVAETSGANKAEASTPVTASTIEGDAEPNKKQQPNKKSKRR